MTDADQPLVLRALRLAAFQALALAPSVAGSWLWARGHAAPPFWPALVTGWLVALALGIPTLLVKAGSLGSRSLRFLPWTLGGNALRAFILLVIVVAVLKAGVANSEAFLVAAVSGYLCCLAGEIVMLHRASQRL